MFSACLGQTVTEAEGFFKYIKELDFERADEVCRHIKNKEISNQANYLKEQLYFSGQRDSVFFKTNRIITPKNDISNFIYLLNRGYFELYYRKTKGNAYRYFYQAYQLAHELKNQNIQKASLLALLEYYHFEISQNSNQYEKYITEYRGLNLDKIDKIWIGIYELIFLSKKIGQLDESYFKIAAELENYKSYLDDSSPLIARVDFEIGLRYEIEKNYLKAIESFEEAFRQSKDYPHLRDIRFFSLLRLSGIYNKQGNPQKALNTILLDKKEIDLADTLRSNYYINLYSSTYYDGLKKFDTAYSLLKKAYIADFQLDYRSNSLEINRLNVVLKTQQKEIENNNLKHSKTWLTVALGVLILLLSLSYLGYKNLQKKKKLVDIEKELQTQKIEKLLKEQELLGIDAMIEGQEKERQRIANDLHDNLGSLLATLKLHFQNLKIKKDRLKEDEDKLLQKTDDLIEEAYQKVRSIAHAKNAGVHAQEGLLPAVKNFAYKVSIANKLLINVIDHGMDERLENSLEITLFRIIQELITNIIKHSKATDATIHLTHHDDSINILVEDNGQGFDITTVNSTGGMGIDSIKKRVENLNGTLTIESLNKSGTTVIIDIPIV